MSTPNLAKSLHTITVYERLIGYFTTFNYPADEAAVQAKRLLGHEGMTDTYGLVQKAVDKVTKEKAKAA